MEFNQIFTIIMGAICLGLVIYCYITRKDYAKYSSILSPILTTIASVLHAVGGLVPSNSVIQIAITCITAAVDAAGYAENMWLKGEIEKSMRPQLAADYITDILKEAGIEVTDAITTIIDGAIALTCYFMPHHNNEDA